MRRAAPIIGQGYSCGRFPTLRSWLYACILFSVVAVVVGLPALLRPYALLVGSLHYPGGGLGQHLWLHWHVREVLLGVRSVLFTPMVEFPYGMDVGMTCGNFLLAFLAAPFEILLGQVLGHNLFTLLGVAACGVATWLLAYYVTGRNLPALVAGLFFALSPLLMVKVSLGFMEKVHMEFIPLLALAILALRDRPGWRRALLLGAVGAACGAASWVYAYIATFFAAVLGVWALSTSSHRLRLLGSFVISIVVAVVLAWPALGFLVRGVGGDRPLRIRRNALAVAVIMDGSNVVRHRQRMVSRVRRDPELSIKTEGGSRCLWVANCVGSSGGGVVAATVFVLALIGLFLGGTQTRIWGALALLFWLFSLGPFMQWSHGEVLPAWPGLTGPWWPVLKYLPMAWRVGRPLQAMAVTYVALSVTAAVGLAALFRVAERRAGRPWAWKTVVLVLAIGGFLLVPDLVRPEVDISFYVPAQTSRAGLPPSYRDYVAASRSGGAVLEIHSPFDDSDLQYYQTLHEKPRVNAHCGSRDVLRVVRSLGGGALADCGVRWIILRLRKMSHSRRRKLKVELTRRVGRALPDLRDGFIVWDLGPGAGRFKRRRCVLLRMDPGRFGERAIPLRLPDGGGHLERKVVGNEGEGPGGG